MNDEAPPPLRLSHPDGGAAGSGGDGGADEEGSLLPKRHRRGHKGTFGTVAVVGGSEGDDEGSPRMIGGAALAALAALRSGAGLGVLVAPSGVLDAGLAVAPECTGVALPTDGRGQVRGAEAAAVLDRVMQGLRPMGSATGGGGGCLAVGPGLGEPSEGTRAVVMRALSQERVAVVLDADGLNALATMPGANADVRAATVLTPHPGEWARLAEAFGLEGDATGEAEERRAGAESLARRFGCVVVLKGDDTVVTDGHRSWRLSEANGWPALRRHMAEQGMELGELGLVLEGNPVLATGGVGDVLTGMVAGVMAQHVRPAMLMGERSLPSEKLGGVSLYDAARAAVTAHALAGWEYCRGHEQTGGLLARDLVELAPFGVEALRG